MVCAHTRAFCLAASATIVACDNAGMLGRVAGQEDQVVLVLQAGSVEVWKTFPKGTWIIPGLDLRVSDAPAGSRVDYAFRVWVVDSTSRDTSGEPDVLEKRSELLTTRYDEVELRDLVPDDMPDSGAFALLNPFNPTVVRFAPALTVSDLEVEVNIQIEAGPNLEVSTRFADTAVLMDYTIVPPAGGAAEDWLLKLEGWFDRQDVPLANAPEPRQDSAERWTVAFPDGVLRGPTTYAIEAVRRDNPESPQRTRHKISLEAPNAYCHPSDCSVGAGLYFTIDYQCASASAEVCVLYFNESQLGALESINLRGLDALRTNPASDCVTAAQFAASNTTQPLDIDFVTGTQTFTVPVTLFAEACEEP